MLTQFFKSIGYQNCGYWNKLINSKGSKDNPLWFEFITSENNLAYSQGPLVYIWIVNEQIIYAGTSTQSVNKRMTQGHIGGFRGGSHSGIEKQKIMLELNVNRIDVLVTFKPFFSKYFDDNINKYFDGEFKSIIPSLNEDMNNSRYFEEKLLISIFKPILNH
jgi:hypothetical protein